MDIEDVEVLELAKIGMEVQLLEARAKLAAHQFIRLLPTIYPAGYGLPVGVEFIRSCGNLEGIRWTVWRLPSAEVEFRLSGVLNLNSFRVMMLKTNFLQHIQETLAERKKAAEEVLGSTSNVAEKLSHYEDRGGEPG